MAPYIIIIRGFFEFFIHFLNINLSLINFLQSDPIECGKILKKTLLLFFLTQPVFKFIFDQGVSKLQIETILVKQLFHLEFMDPIKLPF